MQRDDTLGDARDGRAGGRWASWRDELLLSLAARRMDGVTAGRLALTLPSGRSRTIGGGGALQAALKLNRLGVISQAIMRGNIGFAESYMRGDIETEDLGQLIRFYIDNYHPLSQAGGSVFQTRFTDKIAHKMKRNTRRGSRRNIAAHYDLGNAFYELWLDPGMTYSSALFARDAMTLDEAQDEKYAQAIAALNLEPGHRVLEIGCGWGGMAERLVRAGAEVDAITVSREQLAYTQARLAAGGLCDRARVSFTDYRDVEEQYDRIISIEMIEAVGEEHWPVYFSQVSDRLKSGGSAIVQAITIGDADYPLYRSRPDFIQRYIFPGGMLPTEGHMEKYAALAGLTFEPIVRFGQSYARTLRIWRERFEATWPQIEALGFDDRFRKMWLYYLTYCEVGFERAVVDVGHYRFTKL